jgi:hypothetical protein
MRRSAGCFPFCSPLPFWNPSGRSFTTLKVRSSAKPARPSVSSSDTCEMTTHRIANAVFWAITKLELS